eukprot:6527148-Alexandrium_andersonii.AAC.1
MERAEGTNPTFPRVESKATGTPPPELRSWIWRHRASRNTSGSKHGILGACPPLWFLLGPQARFGGGC